MSLFDILQQNRFFQNLPNEDLNVLAGALTLSKHDDGYVFIREGESGDIVYLLIEGTVVVTQEINGTDQILESLSAGNFFGLLALIDNSPRNATCYAVGEVVVASLDITAYQELTDDYARISLAFQRALGSQIASDFRQVNERIHEMLQKPKANTDTTSDVDVAVIGGGPLGMFYAMWVKRFCPQTKVVILERRNHPVHKVGESTLSTTVRAFMAMGLTLPIMRRLFGNKAGLRWFHTDKSDTTLKGHFDIVDIEETYQVERRVLETAIQHLMRTRENLDIRTGVQVFIRKSQFEGDIKQLACQDEDGNDFTINAKVVCDATGPASVLPRHFKTYRKAPELHNTFSYNSYFAYLHALFYHKIHPEPDTENRFLAFTLMIIWLVTSRTYEIRIVLHYPNQRLKSYTK